MVPPSALEKAGALAAAEAADLVAAPSGIPMPVAPEQHALAAPPPSSSSSSSTADAAAAVAEAVDKAARAAEVELPQKPMSSFLHYLKDNRGAFLKAYPGEMVPSAPAGAENGAQPATPRRRAPQAPGTRTS